MLKVIQECGIVLIFHSDIHNNLGIPSARIFQAAASSAIIICDSNSFVKKHFGNSVFYVDESQSSQKIYSQICDYYNWIMNNQEMAQAMAFRSHQIFEESFQMENQLLVLKEMHEEILRERKNAWIE